MLGEAWLMGVLAGIEDASGIDMRECESFVGTSAGAIVAAHLVAGESPRRPETAHDDAAEVDAVDAAGSRAADGLAGAAVAVGRRAGAWAGAIGAPFAPLAFGAAAPGGALLRAAMLNRLPGPLSSLDGLRERIERSGTRFDGRLRVAAVDRSRGRRVMFGSPGAPRARAAEAVTASCAVPWLFEPVEIGGREYVDGGVWSPTNLDAAPAGRDTEVLCLAPTASVTGSSSALVLVRTVARSAVSLEALVLRRRGAVVRLVAPSSEAAALIGLNFMDREPSERVLAAGYRQGLTLGRAEAQP